MQKTALKKLYPTQFYALLKLRPFFPDFGQFLELFKIACYVITVIIENSKKNYAVLFSFIQSVSVTNFMKKLPPSLEIWKGGSRGTPPRATADPKQPGADRVKSL